MSNVAIASKRFQPHRILILQQDGDFVPSLPYEADFDINLPSDQIKRIIISLHGTGGDAQATHSLGRQVVLAQAGTQPQIPAETLVIAPQFVMSGNSNPNENEFTGTLDRDILYWQGGRESANLSGNHADNLDCAPRTGDFSPRFEVGATGGFEFLNHHLVFFRG